MGLDVVENWNGANRVICYGKAGVVATSRLEDQEVAALSLISTASVLDEYQYAVDQERVVGAKWLRKMTADDFRGLSPQIYNRFGRDLRTRLPIDSTFVA